VFKKILSAVDNKELDKLLAIHQDVASHLCKRSSEDQAYDVSQQRLVLQIRVKLFLLQSARELTAATWGQELAMALKQANINIQDPEEEALGSKADRQKVLSFSAKVKNALRDIWTDHATDVFDIGFAFGLAFS
jgi:cohesin loading factor subunit SCC2